MSSVKDELALGELELLDDKSIALAMQKWLGLSAFAQEQKLAAA